MEMTGEQLVPVPQVQTWDALNDTAVLQACVPGCEMMERLSDTEYRVLMTAKVGPVSAKFKGRITLADVDAPRACTLIFEGQGGVAGFAKGRASVTLTPDSDGTRLQYAAKAMVGGKLAQVGSRLIDGVAKKMAEQFFAAFNRHLTEGKS